MRKKEIQKRKRERLLKHNLIYQFLFKLKKEKYFVSSVLAIVISAITLYFVIIQYQSPPDVKCSVDIVQRPDSVYQFQLHIWNEGDQIANSINIQAQGKDVFQWDTSKNKGKSLLYVYPVFLVSIVIAPGGKDFHQITIPQLGTSNREENYLIICCHIYKIDHYKSLPNLIVRDKFMRLENVPNVKSYFEELTENLKVSFAGKSLSYEIENVINLDEATNYNYYYPTYYDFINYRDESKSWHKIINPNSKDGKAKKSKDDDSWFPFF